MNRAYLPHFSCSFKSSCGASRCDLPHRTLCRRAISASILTPLVLVVVLTLQLVPDVRAQYPLTGSSDGPVVTLSWPADPSKAAYRVYGSLGAITDFGAEGVLRLAELPSTPSPAVFQQRVEIPHENYRTAVQYAVTSVSTGGIEDFAGAAAMGFFSDWTVQPQIGRLTSSEASTILANIAAHNVSKSGFPPAHLPFRINHDRRTHSDAPSLPTNDADNSATFWVGYSTDGTLFIYGEVLDDNLTFAPDFETGYDTWQYDSFEMAFGGYAPTSWFVGSPHSSVQRGATPDYQIRIAPRVNTGGDIVNVSTFEYWSLTAEIPAASTAAVALTSASKREDAAAIIGWKFLTAIPLGALDSPGDAEYVPPAASAVSIVPATFAINDADGGTRDHQTNWSIKPNMSDQWWNTPNQWPTVALVGPRSATTAVPVLLNPYLGATQVPLPVRLEWTPVPNARYDVQVSLESDHSPAIWTTNTPGTSADFPGPGVGPFYWRVRSVVSGVTSSWSSSGYFSGQTSLPVELVSFDAIVGKDDVVLNWLTATETNNAGFYVQEKSPAAEAFSSLVFVDGHGSTSDPHEYTIRLPDVDPGRHMFRLKQVDYDGTVAFSNALEVTLDMVDRFVLEPAYPNPFNPSTTIRFAVASEQELELRLYDTTGRLVRSLYRGKPEPGSMQTIRIDGAGLPSGAYIVRLEGSGFSATRMLLLAK